LTGNLKELLYIKLNTILISLEDRDIRGAIVELEELIYKISNDQI